jgi:hypothetical protein
MSVEIWLAIISIVATPSGAAITAALMRRKYRVEIEALRADVDKRLSEVTSNELSNVREGNDILMKQIVEPLKAEIKQLRSDVNKFRRAIEKIPACPVGADCPVSRELLDAEKDAEGKPDRPV